MNKLAIFFLILTLIFSGCAAPAAPAATQPAAIPTAAVDSAATQAALAAETAAAEQAAAATQAVLSTGQAAAAEATAAVQAAAATLTAATEQSAQATQSALATVAATSIEDIAAYEMKGSFDFCWEQANTEAGSPGYGLVRDRYPGSEGIASMASVGFGLTAYLIGIHKGYITEEQGFDRVNQTLDTLLAMDRMEGFFYHFVDMKTGKRAWSSEVSSIDTAILMMGVLSVGQYFGGEIQTKADKLYAEVNWPWFIDPGRNMFYMAYRPEKGFEGYWDFYAEQLMLYVLAAGSETYPTGELPYYIFTRHSGKIGEGKPFIHSWFNSIFTYQFSHAWIDFRGYTDKKDTNWFDNSVEASLAHYNYAVLMQKKYKTLGPNAWGLTASDGPGGYNGLYGAPPSGFDNKQHQIDDTIAPSGAIGSVVFLPEQALQAMRNYYTYDRLKGKYGFKDAYNLSKNWFASDVIGIDKGISLLMLANYQDGFVYTLFMQNTHILRGLEQLSITKK